MEAPLGKSARFRGWLTRHLAAMIAVVIVLAVLGWKNEFRVGMINGGTFQMTFAGTYGWPWNCVDRSDLTTNNFPTAQQPFKLLATHYSISSWPSLLLDASFAAVWLIVTWVLFSRTQRRCQRWWQFSLATLFAVITLAAVICAVLKSESHWGW